MRTKTKTEAPADPSRRKALAAIGATIGAFMAAPSVAHADSDTPTKKDAEYISFEIAKYSKLKDQFERVPNKVTVIDSTASDATYPSSKAVYDYIKNKVNYQHDSSDKGKSHFVGANGNCTLKDYTVDDKLKEDSSNPVQSKVIYKAIEDLKKQVSLDERPQKHEDTGDEVTADLKYVCKSNGYYVTYQQGNECPASFADCEQNVNYVHSGKTITSNQQTWALKRVDDAFMALCEDEFGGVFLAKKADSMDWTPPQAIWHT